MAKQNLVFRYVKSVQWTGYSFYVVIPMTVIRDMKLDKHQPVVLEYNPKKQEIKIKKLK